MRLSKTTALCLTALLLLGALQFLPFILGGLFVFRDAGYFFLPLREIASDLLRQGEFPFWNDFASNGRALAANPNAGAFWPLTFLLVVLTPSQLVLLHLALVLLSSFAALRWLRLAPAAALWGGAVFLFSGVFQTLPILFTTLASTIPLPLALAAVAVPSATAPRALLRRYLFSGFCLGLSFLGGEPVITATGAGGVTVLVILTAWRDRQRARTFLASWVLLAIVAGGVAMVQLLPALGELRRSARQESMRPEDGALYWSVRPSRVLTLLEPRLTGDPFSEHEEEYWGAGTFDAKNPYFYDLAIGLLPLLLAGAAWRHPVGKGALLLAGVAAFASFGRFVPGYADVAQMLSVIRYPEKWWIVATLGLSAASACGFDRFLESFDEAREASRPAFVAFSGALLLIAGLLAAAPSLLARLLQSLGLGTGEIPRTALLSVLILPVGLSLATLALCAFLVRLARQGTVSPRAAGAILAGIFLLDATRRTAESCPAGPSDLFAAPPEHVQAVVSEMARGRFHDEGANVAAIAVRRVLEAEGFDFLRPITGAIFGVRYTAENDIDRMTPAASVAFSRFLARMPWSTEKIRLLTRAGVSVARVPVTEPLLSESEEIAHFGGDRIVRLSSPRPEYSLATSAVVVPKPDPASGSQGSQSQATPATQTVVEDPARAPGVYTFGDASLWMLYRTSSRQSMEITSPETGGLLLISRTYDPNWKASVNGKPVEILRADHFLSALALPPGPSRVDIAYRNRSILAGAMVTLGTALGLALFAILSRRGVDTAA